MYIIYHNTIHEKIVLSMRCFPTLMIRIERGFNIFEKFNFQVNISFDTFFPFSPSQNLLETLLKNSIKRWLVANCTNLDWKIISFAAKISKGRSKQQINV